MLQCTEYSRLRQIAGRLMQNESACTLTATGLVHELLLRDRQLSDRLVVNTEEEQETTTEETTTKLPYASRMMKQILIDRARRRKTRKRSENETLAGSRREHESASQFVVDLDDAIDDLGAAMPEHAELVRLHLYAELSIEEVAEKLQISRATAYRQWAFCRSWLASRIRNSS